MRLNKLAFAYTSGIFCAVFIFLVMSYSFLTGRVSHLLARLAALHWAPYSWGGTVLMMVEYAIGGFISGWIFAWLYNKFIKD